MIIVPEQIEQAMRVECELNSISAHKSGALPGKKTRFPRRIVLTYICSCFFLYSIDKIKRKYKSLKKKRNSFGVLVDLIPPNTHTHMHAHTKKIKKKLQWVSHPLCNGKLQLGVIFGSYSLMSFYRKPTLRIIRFPFSCINCHKLHLTVKNDRLFWVGYTLMLLFDCLFEGNFSLLFLNRWSFHQHIVIEFE